MWWWRWSMLELFNMVATSYMRWLRSSNNILSYLILINLKLNTIATYGWWLPYWAVPWDNRLPLLSTYSVPMRVRADAKEMKLFCWGNDLSPALAGGIPNVDMLSGTAQEGQLIFQPSWHWEIWPSEFDVGFRQHGLKTELRQSTLTWKLGHDYQKCCFKQCSKTVLTELVWHYKQPQISLVYSDVCLSLLPTGLLMSWCRSAPVCRLGSSQWHVPPVLGPVASWRKLFSWQMVKRAHDATHTHLKRLLVYMH